MNTFEQWLNSVSLSIYQAEQVKEPRIIELLKKCWEDSQAQLKPSWKDAPEWANYLAQDNDGKWFWFESEPRTVDLLNCKYWVSGDDEAGCKEASLFDVKTWEDSLEKRP